MSSANFLKAVVLVLEGWGSRDWVHRPADIHLEIICLLLDEQRLRPKKPLSLNMRP